MAQQKFQDANFTDEYIQQSSRFDDIERMQEIEQEMAKSESGKLSLAGVMAIAAAVGLIIAGNLNSLIGGGGLLSFLQGMTMLLGSGAALYGLGKMVKMLTSKNLDLPALNVLRKTVAANSGQKVNQKAYQGGLNQQANRGSYSPSTEKTSSWKRSRRSRVFSGVAGGLAEYMGISPALVRAFFVVGLFTIPFSFFVYIILAMVLPKNYDDWRNRYEN